MIRTVDAFFYLRNQCNAPTEITEFKQETETLKGNYYLNPYN